MRATGLVQPGSLVRWHYRLRLPANDTSDAAAKPVAAQARSTFPDAGWDIRTRSNASPQLERNVERFTQFLTLVGLTALLVGGVGVANAVKSHLDRSRDVIATMKALGATGGARLCDLSHAGSAAGGGRRRHRHGARRGAAVPDRLGFRRHHSACRSRRRVHPGALALALVYGLLTALAFALWPLGRAHDVPVGALFRDAVAPQPRWPRRLYIALTAVAAAALTALAVVTGL